MLRRFVVLGSTGKHYTVTLAASLTCQCMDFRYGGHPVLLLALRQECVLTMCLEAGYGGACANT